MKMTAEEVGEYDYSLPLAEFIKKYTETVQPKSKELNKQNQIYIWQIFLCVSWASNCFKTRHNIDEVTCAKQDEWFQITTKDVVAQSHLFKIVQNDLS